MHSIFAAIHSWPAEKCRLPFVFDDVEENLPSSTLLDHMPSLLTLIKRYHHQ
ncbi:hypothetical protein RvY_18820 [Ramazzottius varieornatus]|uniref:Uncharacterized protein n=1 Tax=Ramazzottius varieornatus TaxID=947166 RepID=A0A1D1WA19_RAMVA|nr:hypothetical protein RvY_18820 [Ramazzottius varieornatus]